MQQEPKKPAATPEPGEEPGAAVEPAPDLEPTGTPHPEETEQLSEYKPELIDGAMFPHEVPTEHWNADFGNPKQVYQTSDLPIWILAGWAAFIIWAVVYLYAGLSEF